MARGKKVPDTDTVSDPSEGEPDSDDSMQEIRRTKKTKRDQTKTKPAPRKASPEKKRQKQAEDGEIPKQIDEDEDNEQRGLAHDYDEDDLLNIEVPEAPVPCMAADGGDRLMITDIVVENFKSYYGTRRIGPFHQSFTSIIGPNGSGKSNVIDALLFVFGYKASKIRSKKVSVLIHSSNGKDDLPSCTVTISFQKIIDIMVDGKAVNYDVVPNSGFNVSRTAFKDNKSEYRLDGRVVKFKQVAERLKKVGIDLIHNRFLILQGEVEQIAMMKPKSVNGTEDGMLEYLEDIIGSSRYKIPIEKLASKLEKLQDEKSHQIAKVNAANREKEALDEPVQNTLEYMGMENELAALRCKQFLSKKYDAEDKIEALQPKKLNAENEVSKVENDLKEVIEQLKEKRNAADELSKHLMKLQTEIHKTSQELEILVQREKKRVNDLNRVNTEMKKLNAEEKKEQQKLEDAQQAPIKAKEKMARLNEELEEAKAQMASAQDLFDEHLPEYTQKTESHRAKKTKMEEEYSTVAGRLAEAESKCKIAESALRSLMEEYEKKKGQMEDVERSLKANRDRLDKDQESLTGVRAEIEKQDQLMKDAREEIGRADARVEEIMKRQAELAPLLSEQNREAQVRQETNRMGKIFAEARAKAEREGQGAMSGYIGRMGELGSIDPKYDLAVSNNFGGSLDLYVGTDPSVVRAGIEILKKMGLRSSFISIDRVQHLWTQIKKCQREKGNNEHAPRLFNLIDCEDKYKPLFFFAVKWAYVVPTIDDASALRKKLLAMGIRETIVSLDGCQINHKGMIIGGGQLKEGKMLTTGKPKPERRESLTKNDEEAARKLMEAQAENRDLEAERQELVQRKRNLEYQLSRIAHPLRQNHDKIRELERQIKVTEDRIRVQEQQRNEREREMEKAKVDEKEVEKKEKEIDQLKKERDAVLEESKSSKARIKEMDNEMAKVYNKLVKPHESLRDSSRESITRIEKELSTQQAVINGAERNITKQQNKLNDVRKDVEQKRSKSENLASQEEAFETTKTEKQEELDELNKRKDDMDEKLKTIRESTGELDTEEIALEKKKKLMNEALIKIKDDERSLQRKIEDQDKLIGDLELHDMAELLFEIPEDMRKRTVDTRFLLAGESDSDVDDYEEFMTTSPSKKKELKETKKTQKEEKKRKVTEDDEEEEEEEGEEGGNGQKKKEVKEEEEEEADMLAIDTGASTGDEVPMEEDETEDQREERKAKKLISRRARREEREEALKNGKMPVWSRRHIQNMEDDDVIANVDTLERRLASMKKQLQPHVIEDYTRKVKKLRTEGALLTEIKEKFVAHRDKLEGLKKARLADFMGGFESISTALRELYQMITLGGDASLELKDVIDPFIEGVQFMVRPPKKSWKQIENLSGGEKTLSSLALVFALHKYRPTPLYVMDEIDAALDFRNVSIIGHYIKDRTKNAQFIIISLRNNMFELADRLIGIYKVHDCTRNVVVDPKGVVEDTQPYRDGLEKVRRLIEVNKIQQAGVGI